MSKLLIFLIFAFIAVVYIFTFVKWRKRKKKNNVSAIDEFKDKYVNKSRRVDPLDSKLYDSKISNSKSYDSTLYDYIESDNSDKRIDYIAKDEFISEIQAEINNSKLETRPQKKYELHF